MTDSGAKLRLGFRLAGPSTRKTTLVSGETVVFDKSVLDDTVQHSGETFTSQGVEHINYLPPFGRIAEMALVEIDGDFFLAVREELLASGDAGDISLPAVAVNVHQPAGPVSVNFATEPRNFSEEDFAALRADAPMNVGEILLHSALPPIIWSFIIASGIGAGAFLKGFLEQLGVASSEVFVSWLRGAAARAQLSNREQMAEFRFKSNSGISVLAFCPFDPGTDASVIELRNSLNQLADVAAFTGGTDEKNVPQQMRQVAFIWDRDRWRLAWWASDRATFVNPWFRDNAPDPVKFLGYRSPMLGLLGAHMPNLSEPDVECKDQSPPGTNLPPPEERI